MPRAPRTPPHSHFQSFQRNYQRPETEREMGLAWWGLRGQRQIHEEVGMGSGVGAGSRNHLGQECRGEVRTRGRGIWAAAVQHCQPHRAQNQPPARHRQRLSCAEASNAPAATLANVTSCPQTAFLEAISIRWGLPFYSPGTGGGGRWGAPGPERGARIRMCPLGKGWRPPGAPTMAPAL